MNKPSLDQKCLELANKRKQAKLPWLQIQTTKQHRMFLMLSANLQEKEARFLEGEEIVRTKIFGK